MLPKNLYDAFNSCLESYPDYFGKNHVFLTEFFPLKSGRDHCLEKLKLKPSSEKFFIQLEGVRGSGKRTLARSLFHALGEKFDLAFVSLSHFSWKSSFKKKLFLYVPTEALSVKKSYTLLQDLLKKDQIEILLLGGEKGSFLNIEKKIHRNFDCSLFLPSFEERVSDHLLLLSYFFEELSSPLSLTKEALSYYTEKKPAKTVFDLKYACLWVCYQGLKLGKKSISRDFFEETFSFVIENRQSFLMLEKMDFHSLADLVGEVGYRELLSFQDSFLIEMIMRSQHSYSESSRYTGLPVTTIRSKRLKFLK